MADLLDEFMEGLCGVVDEIPEDATVPPLSVEDYEIDPTLKEVDAELSEKQRGKRPRGSDDTYEPVTEGGEIFVKRPRIDGCPNLTTLFEKKFDKPTINSSVIRDHLSECLRLKHDMNRWDGMDEAELRTQMFLSLFEV